MEYIEDDIYFDGRNRVVSVLSKTEKRFDATHHIEQILIIKLAEKQEV